ncbi:MAG: 3-oxoacyl-ACP synthase III [Desulfobacterales bacterium]
MRYNHVYMNALGYELPYEVVSSEDLEARLAPLYETLHFKAGQLEALTGVRERRFWPADYPMHQGAVAAGKKALAQAGIQKERIGMLVYGGVCRDHLEPATACAVAHGLELAAHVQVFDLSNACLGMLNGMLQVANAIELGFIEAGLVVSCESARQIMDLTIERLLERGDMETFKKTVATLTGGSGAVAVILSRGDQGGNGHRLIGATLRNAVSHHRLCRWGPDTGIPATAPHAMETDSVAVLQHGVRLGLETYQAFKTELGWPADKPDRIICHQVGAAHQKTILDAIGISEERDFATYPYLGNIGTVSLPITAAIAQERGCLETGDLVGFLGIGSGLNCLMLGLQW